MKTKLLTIAVPSLSGFLPALLGNLFLSVPSSAQDVRDLMKTPQQAVSMSSLPDGNIFLDYGRAAFGQIELDLKGNDGDTVYVHLGECIKDGRVDRSPGGSRRYRVIAVPLQSRSRHYAPVIPADKRNTGKSAVKMPKEIGEVYPFRYCEIEGYKGRLSPSDVRRIAVNVRFNDDAASFRCDNEALNRVWELCKYSIKATSFTGIYIDGDRERIPYEADALINQLGHYGVDAEYGMARRTFEWLMRHPTWPTEWIMQTVLIAWNDYLWTGSTDLISRYADVLKARTLTALVDPDTLLVTTVRGQTPEFLRSIHRKSKIKDIVDWPHSKKGKRGFQKGEDDAFVYTNYNAVVNAYHYESVNRLAVIMKALGRNKDAEELEAYAKKFRDIFNNAFLDKTAGIYRDGIGTDHSSQHANMFPLAFGLVPKGNVKSVTDFVISRGLACSVYGSQFLLDALFEGGNAQAAIDLMTNDSDRGWLNMLNEGSTITMEAWGNKYKSNQDWNHAWGAAPANIIPFRLLGVRPTSPGYRTCEIRPQIGNLRHAEGKVPTPYGSISVTVDQKVPGEYDIKVSCPKEIKYEIVYPKK